MPSSVPDLQAVGRNNPTWRFLDPKRKLGLIDSPGGLAYSFKPLHSLKAAAQDGRRTHSTSPCRYIGG
jgi:hypothetical protein